MRDSNACILGKRAFSLQLPRKPGVGDEIVVKGTLKKDANRFSIIMCLTRPDNPQAEPERIAYRFGLLFDSKQKCRVIQNCKNINWEDSPLSTDEGFNKRKVDLVFRFDSETIKVFIDDTQHAADYEYEHRFPIEQIQLIEVWDDIEKLQEIGLRFCQ